MKAEQSLEELRQRSNSTRSQIVAELNSVLSKDESPNYQITSKAMLRWESGEGNIVLTPEQMLKLCKLYNVTLAELVQATRKINEKGGDPEEELDS